MSQEPLPRGDAEQLRSAIAAHAFCHGIAADHIAAMADAATSLELPAGSFVFRRGGPTTAFYLVTEGSIALEVASPGRDPLTVETLHAGEALGWSWLFPGRDWQFDARCLDDVTTVAIDATRLRTLVDDDPAFGRDLVLRIGRVVVDRLIHARAQLVDIHHHDDR